MQPANLPFGTRQENTRVVENYTMIQELVFTIFPGSHLSKLEHVEMLKLCSRAFNTNYKSIYSRFSDPVHILGRLEGKLVSHALWITRWMQCGDNPILRTAYVEAVATDPKYRGRGYASQLIGVLNANIQDYELGGLSPNTFGLYKRLGWEHWRGPTYIRTNAGLLYTPYEIMILRTLLTPALDLESAISAEWRPGELW